MIKVSHLFHKNQATKIIPLILIAIVILEWPKGAIAQIDSIGPPAPYEAPQYVLPPPPKSHLNFIENKDGTLTETRSNLMWAKSDSYADLGRCLNWYDSMDYAKNLRTGGYAD